MGGVDHLRPENQLVCVQEGMWNHAAGRRKKMASLGESKEPQAIYFMLVVMVCTWLSIES